MLKAYDTQLDMEVLADEAAINGDAEYYRYECACCGESVNIAAGESRRVSTHFRHRNGNNETECNLYLGGGGRRLYERGTNGGNLDIYFDELQKTFQLGIAFSDASLQEHENVASKLSISGTTDYTYRDSTIDKPFYEEHISINSFVPNEQKRIIISQFSRLYVLRNGMNQASKFVKGFCEQGKLTVFKVLKNSDDNITAKLIKSNILYTGVRYFVVSHENKYAASQFSVPSSVMSEKELAFSTMGMNFFGRIITIVDVGEESIKWCCEAGYDLEMSEQFGVLWPPVAMIDDVQVVDSEDVIAFASFKLKPRGNIKINPRDIYDIGSNCYRLRLSSKVKLLYKNAEAMIEKGETVLLMDIMQQAEIVTDRVTVGSDLRYFCFSSDGVKELPSNMQYLLFAERRVKAYQSNYLVKEFMPLPVKRIQFQELITDIKKTYRTTEDFNPSDFLRISSLEAKEIISESIKTGLINSAVRRLILGGVL